MEVLLELPGHDEGSQAGSRFTIDKASALSLSMGPVPYFQVELCLALLLLNLNRCLGVSTSVQPKSPALHNGDKNTDQNNTLPPPSRSIHPSNHHISSAPFKTHPTTHTVHKTKTSINKPPSLLSAATPYILHGTYRIFFHSYRVS